ncbi:MAG: hypothetical protein U1F68_14350 [Gammaproteobacteria bacterium]
MFEGARVLHKVTRLQDNELRRHAQHDVLRRPARLGFQALRAAAQGYGVFGVRALWT